MDGVSERTEPYDSQADFDPRPRLRFTFDQVLDMVRAGVLAENARVELLDGELIEMQAENGPHRLFKRRLGGLLWRTLDPLRHEVVVDSTLHLGSIWAPEPDVYVFPRGVSDAPIVGSALELVVELADTSLRIDLVRKARLYATFSVPEYWVVDLTCETLWVHRDPDGAVYRDVRQLSRTDRITPLAIDEFDFAQRCRSELNPYPRNTIRRFSLPALARFRISATSGSFFASARAPSM